MDPSIGALWRGWRDVLSRLGFQTAALDAKLLAGHALGLDALGLATREGDAVSDADAALVAALMQRRMSGESVGRIIGMREFYGLPFALSPATLEPRPDTELLVDLALKQLPQGGHLLDLGTGSGCIPIAVLANRKDARGLATDLNPDALAMARANAERNGVADRLDFAQGNWFEALAGEGAQQPMLFSPSPASAGGRVGVSEDAFDLILSNPPYIASSTVDTLSPEVKDFDPRLALDGGPDGLAPYRIIAAEAKAHLSPSGVVLVEIGYDQAGDVAALFEHHAFAGIAVHKDLNGLDRVISAHHLKDK
ncbi:[protein release factor]-glutamine N5-methyltransferase [Devosia lucknowensis]|uniref:Release factor glutamine methyltransferase n=1 Tax=Devosia lucknowensis TaxID=1096929 RepID=A0A1Y6G9E8_9HYPH|nr:peptide chain release factor N(5)-glutamine methyltransferase [Devosia lucknowensis]SMQ86354.1 [protein release factor]-glutamine N5-methyltransferase [Devosia lucknowensis]